MKGVDDAVREAFSALLSFGQVGGTAPIFRRHWLQANYVRVVREVLGSMSFVSTPQLEPVFTFVPEILPSQFRCEVSQCMAAQFFSEIHAEHLQHVGARVSQTCHIFLIALQL